MYHSIQENCEYPGATSDRKSELASERESEFEDGAVMMYVGSEGVKATPSVAGVESESPSTKLNSQKKRGAWEGGILTGGNLAE